MVVESAAQVSRNNLGDDGNETVKRNPTPGDSGTQNRHVCGVFNEDDGEPRMKKRQRMDPSMPAAPYVCDIRSSYSEIEFAELIKPPPSLPPISFSPASSLAASSPAGSSANLPANHSANPLADSPPISIPTLANS
ncbi:hypothetical protein AMATHDRAFT_51188 [Amanita thiersii Skay4041]|uniref:Uncharacterized protein n=1 Tax=Amanita thiersii Skay4041 TaxID=703135 RepID=A0A2A9NDC8_9AGAR|nr:hypothetical protein AMATHDRAFT_51188 [Amanita thiersii Skay4041]